MASESDLIAAIGRLSPPPKSGNEAQKRLHANRVLCWLRSGVGVRSVPALVLLWWSSRWMRQPSGSLRAWLELDEWPP